MTQHVTCMTGRRVTCSDRVERRRTEQLHVTQLYCCRRLQLIIMISLLSFLLRANTSINIVLMTYSLHTVIGA